MKGIVLAGGSGSRLSPLTCAVSKQLLPVYDKPLIYYSLSALMLAGIREVLLIASPRDLPRFQELFGGGGRLGMRFEYAAQDAPRGVAEALRIGAPFIGGDCSALVLGDNIFYGNRLAAILRAAAARVSAEGGAVIFGYYVKDPREYGVLAFDAERSVAAIEEKPHRPRSHYAVPGLYFYDSAASAIAEAARPSARGELEITAVNNEYLSRGRLSCELIGRGTVWLDAGTCDGLLDAALFVQAIQKRQGMYVSCIEEIAFRNGWISRGALREAALHCKSGYGDYLRLLAEEAGAEG